MKVKGLDGKIHNLNLAMYKAESKSCSQNHKRARAFIKTLFPMTMICEEVSLPGSSLFADFVVPDHKLMVEVHGEQHYQQVQFFQPRKIDFAEAKRRDSKKEMWCEINGFRLVALDHKETDDEWREKFTAE